jgi:hypothetical protein
MEILHQRSLGRVSMILCNTLYTNFTSHRRFSLPVLDNRLRVILCLSGKRIYSKIEYGVHFFQCFSSP